MIKLNIKSKLKNLQKKMNKLVTKKVLFRD